MFEVGEELADDDGRELRPGPGEAVEPVFGYDVGFVEGVVQLVDLVDVECPFAGCGCAWSDAGYVPEEIAAEEPYAYHGIWQVVV